MDRLEAARRTRKAIEMSAGTLNDEQIMKIPSVFPEWSDSYDYSTGDIVNYDGALYRCVQSHTSQASWTPTAAPSLWTAISDPHDEYPLWIQPTGAHNAYAKGDKVTYNGKKYISNVDGNVWEPPEQWTEVS